MRRGGGYILRFYFNIYIYIERERERERERSLFVGFDREFHVSVQGRSGADPES